MLKENFYNKKDVYDEHIAPIIRKLKDVCNIERMPMFVSVAIENKPDATNYANEVVLASTGTALADNRIANILLSMNKFDIDYPEYIKKDIRELEEYLEQTKSALATAPILDLKLAEDKTIGFQQIVLGGNKAVLSENMKKGPNMEDIWEE